MNFTSLPAFNQTRFPQSTNVTSNWELLPVLQVTFNVAAALNNGYVLLIFFTHRSLLSAFNIYLVFLLGSNFLFSITAGPLDILNNVYSNWFLGSNWCTAYIFLSWFFQTFLCYIHLAIGSTRIWAVFFPHHYRQFHNRRVAISICLATAAGTVALLLPFLVIDHLTYRLPEFTNGCMANIDKQTVYFYFIQIVFTNACIPAMLAIFLVLSVKEHQRRKHRIGAEPITGEPSAKKVVQGAKSSSHGFKILAILTVSVFVCWVPNFTYYTMLLFVKLEVGLFYKIITLLYYAESVLDPVHFLIALPQLREAASKLRWFWNRMTKQI